MNRFFSSCDNNLEDHISFNKLLSQKIEQNENKKQKITETRFLIFFVHRKNVDYLRDYIAQI